MDSRLARFGRWIGTGVLSVVVGGLLVVPAGEAQTSGCAVIHRVRNEGRLPARTVPQFGVFELLVTLSAGCGLGTRSVDDLFQHLDLTLVVQRPSQALDTQGGFLYSVAPNGDVTLGVRLRTREQGAHTYSGLITDGTFTQSFQGAFNVAASDAAIYRGALRVDRTGARDRLREEIDNSAFLGVGQNIDVDLQVPMVHMTGEAPWKVPGQVRDEVPNNGALVSSFAAYAADLRRYNNIIRAFLVRGNGGAASATVDHASGGVTVNANQLQNQANADRLAQALTGAGLRLIVPLDPTSSRDIRTGGLSAAESRYFRQMLRRYGAFLSIVGLTNEGSLDRSYALALKGLVDSELGASTPVATGWWMGSGTPADVGSVGFLHHYTRETDSSVVPNVSAALDQARQQLEALSGFAARPPVSIVAEGGFHTGSAQPYNVGFDPVTYAAAPLKPWVAIFKGWAAHLYWASTNAGIVQATAPSITNVFYGPSVVHSQELLLRVLDLLRGGDTQPLTVASSNPNTATALALGTSNAMAVLVTAVNPATSVSGVSLTLNVPAQMQMRVMEVLTGRTLQSGLVSAGSGRVVTLPSFTRAAVVVLTNAAIAVAPVLAVKVAPSNVRTMQNPSRKQHDLPAGDPQVYAPFGGVGDELSFTVESTTIDGQVIQEHRIDFGDGTAAVRVPGPQVLTPVRHSYARRGQYLATVTALTATHQATQLVDVEIFTDLNPSVDDAPVYKVLGGEVSLCAQEQVGIPLMAVKPELSQLYSVYNLQSSVAHSVGQGAVPFANLLSLWTPVLAVAPGLGQSGQYPITVRATAGTVAASMPFTMQVLSCSAAPIVESVQLEPGIGRTRRLVARVHDADGDDDVRLAGGVTAHVFVERGATQDYLLSVPLTSTGAGQYVFTGVPETGVGAPRYVAYVVAYDTDREIGFAGPYDLNSALSNGPQSGGDGLTVGRKKRPTPKLSRREQQRRFARGWRGRFAAPGLASLPSLPQASHGASSREGRDS